SPLLLGSVVLNRFDLWPTLLTAVALAAFLRARQVAGAVGLALAVVTKIFAAAALPVVAVYLQRTARSVVRRAAIAFAAVVAVVAFGKVLSPQYMVWLLPFVPLVRGRIGALATALFVACLVLTRIEFSHWDSINAVGPAVWVLLARNLTLVALFVTLARVV